MQRPVSSRPSFSVKMIMSTNRKYISVAIITSLLFVSTALTKPSEEEVSQVLTSAEMLFQAMADRNYTVIWQSLTAKTHQKTVDSVYKASSRKGIQIEKEEILADFVNGGEIAKAYWDSYLDVFDPEMALKQSKWTINKLKKDAAEINILYKKSPNPAILQLYREDNCWKVGLEETFGARDLIPFK
jgi:hypothetical protein